MDLNWLIPELVQTIQYRKGPYYAEEGDFASAGSIYIDYFNVLPQGIYRVTKGTYDYNRRWPRIRSSSATGTCSTPSSTARYENAILRQTLGYAYAADSDYPKAIAAFEEALGYSALPARRAGVAAKPGSALYRD